MLSFAPVARHSDVLISHITFAMISLNGSASLNNSLCGVVVSRNLTQSRRRISAPVVVSAASSNGRSGERNVSVLMESTPKEMRDDAPVIDSDPKSTFVGGVEDVYGEDSATEDQFITPWSVSVASGYSLLRDPHFNKGLAFTEKERDAHYLRGLLPPVVVNQEVQVKKLMHSIRKYQVPLQRYMAMMDLQERNERLFYKLLIDNVEELLPVVYTPTVGEACEKYGSIFRRPQGLYISLKEKGKILEVLKNWPEKKIQVIVVTDGERILGLGDLGCQGMGIPVGKLSLYTALGGIRPSACLPITIDVGTNNEKLLNDEFYIGLRQRRATGQEYAELVHEFMSAVKQNYGEKVLIQFEDFANHNAFDLLAKYGTTHLVFNDDIQGTASGGSLPLNFRNDLHLQEENLKMDSSFSRWEERVGPAELERAVLSLLEFGQITAAKQLQHKLSPGIIPSEFVLVDAALKLAAISTPSSEVSISMLDDEVYSVIQSYNLMNNHHMVDPLQALEKLATIFTKGRGCGLCKRIIAVVKAANVLGVSFSEAFDKQPVELLQLLSLKAQDSFVEANLLVHTHTIPAASVAQILAESFLKGLLAAHRGGYMDSQEEGPAPLLWRFSDFLKWADLCSSEPEIGHALMRLVITGQEIPHACEVELLILSHHFYKSSACLDGVDVLVALAATRVEAYVSEGDFPCLARLITGVGNFHALNFILGILIENGQLDLLLQKYSAAADTNTSTAEAVRGFRMAVLTSLKQFNPNDLDAFALVYNHFDMKHETASLLESRAEQSSQQWFLWYDKDQNEDLLESMRFYIEAAEVHSSIDAGNKTHVACARASLVSLQIRMPDFQWLNLSETNARRALVEQSRFQEALIVAEAYGLNQPSEWALVLWNQMLKPELTEQFVAEFVAVLPLQPTMLAELARFYRAEVAARGDQSQFSVWLTGGGLPAEWAKYLGRSFRCLLKRTRDLRLRLQLATVATGFGDVIDALMKALDRVPDNAGPLVLRKGHGGAYLPLM